MKLHVCWGHTSAQQLKRVLVDSEGNNMHLVPCVDEVLARCEVPDLRDGATCSGGGDLVCGRVQKGNAGGSSFSG